MAENAQLIQSRGRIKAKVTRMETTFNSNQNISASEAQVRLRKLEEICREFDNIQEKIEVNEPEEKDKIKKFKADNETERQQFEQKYYTLAGQYQKIIDDKRDADEDRRRADQQVINVNQAANGAQMPPIRIEAPRRNKPKLPDIKVGDFHGDYSKWLFWKNNYTTVIHDDPDISDSLKHQYLLGYLKGDALKVIAGFSMNGQNYQQAWQLLLDTYDNQMMIIETHLEELFKFPTVTKENKAESINQLNLHIQTQVQSLKSLAQPVQHWDTLIIYLARKHLDYYEQKEWQDRIKDKTPDSMPTLEEFGNFLMERTHILRRLNQNTGKSTPTNTSNQLSQKDRKSDRKVSLGATAGSCRFCSGDHFVFQCEEFLNLDPKERKKQVMEKRLCLNCLKYGHPARLCNGSTCRKCGDKHNSLLHVDTENNPQNTENQLPAVTHFCTGANQEESVSLYCVKKPMSQVILSTAKVHVHDVNMKQLSCRALLDPGSQVNLITQEFVKKLKLPYSKGTQVISGVDRNQIHTLNTVKIKMQSIQGDFTAEIECLVLKSITERIPQTSIDVQKVNQPRNVQLADPAFNEPGEIHLLIGAGLYWRLIIGAPYEGIKGQPTWQNTRLGWICGGEFTGSQAAARATCFKITNIDLNQQLERFWKQEAIPEVEHYTKEEEKCEEHFRDTTELSGDGRFMVRLPMRPEISLGQSKHHAERRFQSIERRFRKDPELRRQYSVFMDDYIIQNHMSLVTDTGQLNSDEHYYIPHQPVIRPDSITTKLRVVFDASAKTTNNSSLNDKLLPGPNLQGDLFKIIIKFRTHQIVLTGDVAQMYRQILVHPDDRKYQLILWRSNEQEEIRTYTLNTVTYGTACAPFHALRCMKELAIKYKRQYPLAAEALENDLYMDDCLSGGDTIAQVRDLQLQLSKILLEAKFLMRKWRSNDSNVLQHLESQQKEHELLVIDKEEAIKTLGLLWHSRQDTLQYHATLAENTVNTKRNILSKVSQVFDPLGLISPVLIVGKMFIQQLWFNEVDWDEPLNEVLSGQWTQYYASLIELSKIIIPRNVNCGNSSGKFSVFGFADASEKAYGACLYAVSTNQDGVVTSNLLCSKSKVAPLKSISIPRLELEAALLLTNLYLTVRPAIKDKIRDVSFWSDSTIVLGWVKTEPKLLKTFVANRVSKIQTTAENIVWNHVSTTENPADIISRGTSVKDLQENQLWWHGPVWLIDPARRPESKIDLESELPEMKVTTVVVRGKSCLLLNKPSSFRTLCRVIGYCHRFVDNCQKVKREEPKVTGTLKLMELIKAEKSLIKMVQSEGFAEEKFCLEMKRELPKKSPLRALNVFMDENNIIRVGGRLSNAQLSDEQKHPAVLPAKHFVTGTILREKHEEFHHCPPEQLLHIIRQQYWPVGGRREVQKVVRQCIKCFHFRPIVPEVLMGDLPEDRVKAFQRPFTITGVDYAGPIQVRESRRKGRIHISKGYVAVFTCMSTKAVHLELVSDLTTECFLAALSRFTARRGLCTHIYSDNGTNFVGASRELTEIYEFLSRKETKISDELIKQKIEWHFIPPRAPNFGGLWEAAVKQMKRHLYTVTQGKVYTFEEYSTLLTQIEAIMNSRPLTPLTNDPNDMSVLTPSHFLIGDSLQAPVEHSLTELADNRLSRWQQFRKMRQAFWQRWQLEYLQELQKRTKWTSPGQSIELNTLVLMKDDNLTPLQWPMGRVVELHPGRDGIVRVVTIRTPAGVLKKRAVTKICPLPIIEDDNT